MVLTTLVLLLDKRGATAGQVPAVQGDNDDAWPRSFSDQLGDHGWNEENFQTSAKACGLVTWPLTNRVSNGEAQIHVN